MFNTNKPYTPAELEQLLMVKANECSNKADSFIETKRIYEDYADGKKVKFALLMDEQEHKIKSHREHAVLTSEAWAKYLRGISNAHYDYLHAQKEYEEAERDWETVRSLLSSKNTERRTGI